MVLEISLPDDLVSFVNAQVASGHYATPSDVVCKALRLLNDRQERLEWLRQAYQEGLDSGFVDEPLDVETLIAEANAKWNERQSRLTSPRLRGEVALHMRSMWKAGEGDSPRTLKSARVPSSVPAALRFAGPPSPRVRGEGRSTTSRP